jgi:outer membrane receptor for ferrienterochelin and colicins
MKQLYIATLCLLPCLASAEEKVLSTVEVTASGGDIADRRQSATQKVVIGTKDIENMGALSISDVMGKLPGVDAGTPGTDGSMAMRSRGMTRDSVQIFIDGERVAGNARMAQAMIGRLPATELDRVEIIRGASAEFGGNAPVSVNLVFKKARAKDSTTLKAALGMRNDEPNEQFSLSKGGGDARFSWMLPLTINHHNMPSGRELARQDSSGVRQEEHDSGHSTVEEIVFSPRLMWKSGNDNLTITPSLFRAFGKRANDTTRTDFVDPDASRMRNDDEHNRTAFNRLKAEGEVVRAGIKYSGRLAWSDGERRADMKRTTVNALGAMTQSDEHMRRNEVDLGGAFRLDWAMGKHALSAAIEESGHHRDDSQNDAGNAGNVIANESHSGWDRQWSLWVQDEWAAGTAVTLTSGLRGEFIRYAADGDERRYERLLPSLALRWEPAQHWIFRSSLGAGIKPPKLDELSSQPVFSIGTNTPTEADRRGNPGLRAERSLNLEAALERYLPGEIGVVGVNAYLRQTEDFIERRVQLEGARWVDRPWNEGEARHWGMEVDGKLRTDTLGWSGATLRAHLTLPRSRVADQRLGRTRAARESPRYILSAGLDQTVAGGMSLGISLQHSGAVRTDVPGEQDYVTRRRTVVDAYVLRKLTMALNLRLSLQNLLKADTHRQADAYAGTDRWSLTSSDTGTRAVLLSLEGKW